jgi:hypothetical protein
MDPNLAHLYGGDLLREYGLHLRLVVRVQGRRRRLELVFQLPDLVVGALLCGKYFDCLCNAKFTHRLCFISRLSTIWLTAFVFQSVTSACRWVLSSARVFSWNRFY